MTMIPDTTPRCPEYTRGPWHIQSDPKTDSENGLWILEPSGALIADVNSYTPGPKYRGCNGDPMANARLIAAAPELLAACQDALAFNTRADMSLSEHVSRGAMLNDQLRAAIQKATVAS